MATWVERHRQDLESGEIYYQEAAEVTLPRGYRVVWITYRQTIKENEENRYRRPEMKIKDIDEDDPKVFEGNHSGVGMHRHSKFRWWMVSSPIAVTPGLVTRAKAHVMVICHGVEDDNSKPGDCGLRVGIVDADAINLVDDDLSLNRKQAEALAGSLNWDRESEKVTPQIIAASEAKDITWSKWSVVRGSLDNENKWHPLQTDEPDPADAGQPPFIPQGDKVRLVLRCDTNWPVNISAGHYDNLIVEQDLASGAGGAAGAAAAAEPATEVGAAVPMDLAGAPVGERERLIEAALALQEQARILLEIAKSK